MKKVSSIMCMSVLLVGNISVITNVNAESIEQTNRSSIRSDNQNISSGTFGTSNWYLSDTGELHISSGTWPKSLSFNDITPGWADSKYSDSIKKIFLDGKIVAGECLSSVFSNMKNLESIENLALLDTTLTTTMAGMFENDTNLKSVDLSEFSTKNVTNIQYMFSNDSSLTDLNLSSFETSQVKYMIGVFQNTPNLLKIDISSFNTSGNNIIQMNSMFKDSGVRILTLGKNFKFLDNIDNVELAPTTWQSMGSGSEDKPMGQNLWSSTDLMSKYSGLTDADTYISGDEGADVTINYVDEKNEKLHEQKTIHGIVGSGYDVSDPKYQLSINGYVLDKNQMPSEVSGIIGETSKSVTYVYYNKSDFAESGTFGSSDWFVTKEGTLHIGSGTWESGASSPWGKNGSSAVAKNASKIVFDGKIFAGTSLNNAFSGMKNLDSIENLDMLDTSKTTDMSQMFLNDIKLTELNLKTFDTTNVINMESMFKDTKSLKNLNLGTKFKFNANVELSENTWSNITPTSNGNSTEEKRWSTEELIKNYNGSTDAGLYSVLDPAKDVVIKYVNEQGKEIHDSQLITGYVGDTFDASTSRYQLEISGYTLDDTKLPSIVKGQLSDKDQSIVYTYKKNANPTNPTNPSTYVKIFRLYNKNTGEHLYTTSSFERDTLVNGGWNNEGTGWSAPDKGTAVYRVYNPNAIGGDHYYTSSKYEAEQLVNKGWNWDNNGKAIFYSGGRTPVYVAYNPNAQSGSHNYTQSAYEQKILLNNGWKFSSIAFYAQ